MAKTYLKLIGFGLLLTMLISVFSAIGVILKLNDTNSILLQIVAFFIAAIILVLYMEKKGKGLASFGFEKGIYNPILILFMIVIVLIQPFIMGINNKLSLVSILLIIIQMGLVGFVEESLFRAVYLFYLSKNSHIYIWFSSVVFGVLHVASGINPEYPAFFVGLQIINALLLGFVFALVYLKTKSIYTTIVFHATFNLLASISLDSDLHKQSLAVFILVIIYLLFIYYLTRPVKTGKKRDNLNCFNK